MDNYERWAADFIADLQQSPAYARYVPQGSDPDALAATEALLGAPLPAAMRAWYAQCGYRPPTTRDHFAYGLSDIADTLDALNELEATERKLLRVRRVPGVVPFSHRLGGWFALADARRASPHNPPVYTYTEGRSRVARAFSTFTATMRADYLSFIESWRLYSASKNVNDWPSTYRDPALRRQWVAQRTQFARLVEREEQTTGRLVRLRDYQARWVDYFGGTAVWRSLARQGLSMPYGWTLP